MLGPMVTFGKDEALLAVPVGCVQEILDRQPMSWIPGALPHVLGVIDVRGTMVPVIDLRSLLGERPCPDGIDTRILVLRLGTGPEAVAVALRVDRVIEVTSLDADGAEPLVLPSFVSREQRLVEAVGRRNGAFVSVLATDRMLDPGLLAEISAEVSGPAAAQPNLADALRRPGLAPFEPMGGPT